MLSQPDSENHAEAAGDTPIPAPASDVRPGFRGRIPALVKTFLVETFVTSPRLLLAGHYEKRKAAFVIAATCPILLATLLLTIPGFLFPTPRHNEFFHFANALGSDFTSAIPLMLGVISTTLGLRMPLHH